MKSRKLRMIKLLGAYVLLISVLMLSDPTKLPSVLLVIPFVLLFLAVFFTATEVMFLYRGDDQGKIASARGRKPRMTAALIASFPVLLLLLQSIGQLTPWDVLTVVALFIIAYFYIIKSSAASPSR